MLKTHLIIPLVFISNLFGFAFISVTPVVADDTESFNECDSMGKKKGAKYPYKPRMNCFRNLATTLSEESSETEEEAENKIARMEALDNLSDAMEEMFSTCDFNQGSGNYDDNSTHGPSLPLADYRNGARHALAQARKQMRKGSVDTESINESFTECDSMGKKKGAKYPYKPKMNCFRELFDTVAEAEAKAQGMDAKVRPLLGRLAKDGKRIAPLARHDGIAQDLSYFIASIGQREFKGTYKAYLAKLSECGNQGKREKSEYFESFRDILTETCTAFDGEWSGYTGLIRVDYIDFQMAWGSLGGCKRSDEDWDSYGNIEVEGETYEQTPVERWLERDDR